MAVRVLVRVLVHVAVRVAVLVGPWFGVPVVARSRCVLLAVRAGWWPSRREG
ncbi:hypothetical protein ACWDZ8_20690 [Streptomyces sp. NPDC003233]